MTGDEKSGVAAADGVLGEVRGVGEGKSPYHVSKLTRQCEQARAIDVVGHGGRGSGFSNVVVSSHAKRGRPT